MDRRPTVAVLMATHDGRRHLDEQVSTILAQRDVDVRLVISDDASTDGTAEAMRDLANRDPRVTMLDPVRSGSAQANFLRLVRVADVDGVDAVAFADQDDVWHDDKLARQLALLDSTGAGAVSGDVEAVFEHRRVRIRKSQPQRSLDFVCESAGPGCTYLMTPTTFSAVRAVCLEDRRVDDAAAHDWLVYAVARAQGITWHIDDVVLVDYRQHGRNVTGANVGLRAALRRSRRMRSGSFRLECATIAAIAADAAPDDRRDAIARVASDLRAWDAGARLRVLATIPELRRRARDRAALWLATVSRSW